MKYTSIFEKLLCIFNLISDSWLNIAFIGIATILIILFALKKLSKRTCFILITIACFSIFGFTIYKHFNYLSKLADTLIDNLFLNIYFPSTYAYLFVLIVTDIVTIVSLLNPRGEKIYKTIHGICFILINFILTIILEMIAKNGTDIFSKKSLFTNTDLITLLEFSINIFIVWLASLFFTYLINMITERIIIAKENKVLNNSPVNIEANIQVNQDVISDEKLKDEYSKENAKEENILEPSLVEQIRFIPDLEQNHFIINNIKTEKNNNELVMNLNSGLENDIKENTQKDNIIEQVKNNQELNNLSTLLDTIIPPMKEEVTLSIKEENTNRVNYNSNVEFTNTFDLSSFIPRKQEMRPLHVLNSQENTNDIFEKILKNELPVMKDEINVPISVNALEKEKEILEAEKNTYKLNDYHIFKKILKDVLDYNQSNSVTIDKNLEYRLITKYSTETYNMFKKMLEIYSN